MILTISLRFQKLNKEHEREIKEKDDQIHKLESELGKKQKEIEQLKQKVTELTEIMDRQVRDKSRPAEHRQGILWLVLLMIFIGFQVYLLNLQRIYKSPRCLDIKKT